MLRKRLATHESGHTIAAINFGIPIIHATIAAGHPHLLRDRFRRERSLATESLAIVCLSGPAAEALFFGSIDDGSDETDQLMARDYLRSYYRDAEIACQMLRMQRAAERLVSSSRREIEPIAAALMQRGTLTGAEVIDLLASVR
jgi:ATP-dependent Zn protease